MSCSEQYLSKIEKSDPILAAYVREHGKFPERQVDSVSTLTETRRLSAEEVRVLERWALNVEDS